jgi:hypothetical protein
MVKPRRVNARDLQRAGGFEPLVEQLVADCGSSSMDQRELSAMLLRSLTEQASLDEANEKKGFARRENGDVIVDAQRGAWAASLVSLVADGLPSGQQYALGALANLVLNRPERQQAVLDAGGVRSIATCLRMGDAPTQAAAAAATASVSQLQATQAPFFDAGVVPTLVSLLHAQSAVVLQVHAAQALANLARNHPPTQHAMGVAGAVSSLVALLEGGKAQETAALCLQRLAEHSAANRAEITNLEGARKLIALLGAVNEGVQAHAAGALAALAHGVGRTDEQDLIAKVALAPSHSPFTLTLAHTHRLTLTSPSHPDEHALSTNVPCRRTPHVM